MASCLEFYANIPRPDPEPTFEELVARFQETGDLGPLTSSADDVTGWLNTGWKFFRLILRMFLTSVIMCIPRYIIITILKSE